MIRLAHEEYLYGLLFLLLFLALFLLLIRWKKITLRKFGDIIITRRLFSDISKRKPIFKFVIISLAFISLIMGLANPQIGTKMEEVKREGIDIIVALDISNSMKAEDIKPNRLTRSKQSISNLIDKLHNDRIGLIVFAGQAYTQLPITSDYSAAKLFLSSVDTDIIPTQGTAIGPAIELAEKSFSKEEKKYKSLIIISDGESHDDISIDAAKTAVESGIIIHTIGIGSPGGAPIPVYKNGIHSGFRKDENGSTILTKLNESMLQQIASIGNGRYIRASTGKDGLESILEELDKMERKQYEAKIFTDYEDRFQYFLGIALLLLLIELFISERKSKWIRKLFSEIK